MKYVASLVKHNGYFPFFYFFKSFYRYQSISSSQLDTKLIQVLTIVDLDCRQAALLAVDLEPLVENEWQVDWVVAWLLLVASAWEAESSVPSLAAAPDCPLLGFPTTSSS